MIISINNQTKEVASDATLHFIVFSELGEKQRGTAVAVNNKVIPKHEHEGFILNDGDSNLIIKATQGG